MSRCWPWREPRPARLVVKIKNNRSVLLGEQLATKTRGQVSNPCAPAGRLSLPLECDGTAHDSSKVADQVRLLARVLSRRSPRVCRAHGGLLNRKAGFDSRAGDFRCQGPRSVTDAHTTLRRSWTRFNSWRGHAFFLTLEPDGKATGCNPVQVGSTPTGVSLIAQPILNSVRT